MLVFFVFFKVLKHFRPENPGQRASANSPSTHLCLSHSGVNHFLPQFSFCNSEDWGLNDGQGGQLTPRAVPRLRGGLPWREEADFDTFYMAFRFDLGVLLVVVLVLVKVLLVELEHLIHMYPLISPTFVFYILTSKPSGDLFFPNSTFQQVLSNKLLMSIMRIII